MRKERDMTINYEYGDEPRSPVRVKALQGASRKLEVVAHDPEHGRYLVSSEGRPGLFYMVELSEGELTGRCTCPWGEHGGVNCKHVLAALRAHYSDEGQLSFWWTHEDAQRQHRHIVAGRGLYGTLRSRQAG